MWGEFERRKKKEWLQQRRWHRTGRSKNNEFVEICKQQIKNSSSSNTEDTQCSPMARLSIPINDVPVKEFESNDRLLYCAFPSHLLLGKGLTGRGSVSTLAVCHMLMQFTNNFSRCRFYFVWLISFNDILPLGWRQLRSTISRTQSLQLSPNGLLVPSSLRNSPLKYSQTKLLES